MRRSEQLNELGAALAKAQAEIRGAPKDSANPFFKSRYADMASVIDASREALTKQGIAIVQSPRTEGAKVIVTTLMLHASGQWIEDDLAVEAKDAGAQSIGSAITYARRYAYQAISGVAPEDDDGNAATKQNGHHDDRRPVDPPKKIETPKAAQPPVAFQTFASLIKNLCEAGGKESTKEQRKALAGAAAEALGMTFDMLSTQDAATLTKVYEEAERMINGVPTEKGIATADVPY